MFAPSVIELSRGALRGNLRALRRRIGDVALTSVVKGNAYGHGVDVYVPLAEACGVRSFAPALARPPPSTRSAARTASSS